MANKKTHQKNNNLLLFHKKGQFNTGFLLFGIIFIYLVVMIIMYLTEDRTASYEVRMGSIQNDIACTGIAIRKETLVNAPKDGYVNYYSTENTKVRVGTKIYAISDHEIVPETESKEKEKDKEKQISNDQQNSLGIMVHAFTDSFSEEMFSSVYPFKDSVKNSVSSIFSADKAGYLDKLAANKGGLELSRSKNDGLIVYSADGYETLTKDAVTKDIFNRTDYHLNEFSNNMKVSEGDPVYKLITQEEWSVVVPISKKTSETLKGKKSIRVRFVKDNEVLTAELEIEEKEGQFFAYLTFHNSMVRYANERFVDLELILEDETGLKIPKTALVNKPFYIVPMEYIVQGGNSSDRGVFRKAKDKNGNEVTEFVSAAVYYTENDMAYIDPNVLHGGDLLLKPDSNMTYVVDDQKELPGVFNINKGYAVFKQIKILCESDEYYIVESGNDYGLANYDHIALDSKSVTENEIITQ